MGSLNVVIVGTGMYVCGRGTEGYGTIMPALYEWKRRNRLGDVYLAGSTGGGVKAAKRKIRELERATKVNIRVKYFPTGSASDRHCYKKAVREISKPAVCIVAVPDNLHREIAGEAIKEGLHTLVVKPLAPTLNEVRELIALQKKTAVYCAVEFHKRFDAANCKLRDVVRDNIIGDPLYFAVEYSQRKSVPSERFKRWVSETNIFQYLGVHYADIIYFATGALPIRVMAVGQYGWLKSKDFDTYDSIESMIEWKMPSGKKFISQIMTNWIDPESTTAMSDQKIKVIGTKGRFESDQKSRGITIVTDYGGVEEPNPYFCSPFNPDGRVEYKGYGIESIQQFLSDVRDIEDGMVKIDELEAKRPTFKESIISTAIIECVNKSLRQNGSWVNIKGVR